MDLPQEFWSLTDLWLEICSLEGFKHEEARESSLPEEEEARESSLPREEVRRWATSGGEEWWSALRRAGLRTYPQPPLIRKKDCCSCIGRSCVW